MKDHEDLFIYESVRNDLPESEMSKMGRYLPQGIQEKGNKIRTFMPRYGVVNERRHQLHEVIRLSGMNLIIDDTDHPLIIKVASIQSARMQVYFIDNEDYFHRKSILKNKEGKDFGDNDERAIFFARGVLETVKKLRWSPDIVHCIGWFAGLIPLYLKKTYHDDPLFMNTKIVYSVYPDSFSGPLNKNFKNKLQIEGINDDDLNVLKSNDYIDFNKLAILHSDGVAFGSPDINPTLLDFAKDQDVPTMSHEEHEQYVESYSKFYNRILNGN